MLGAQAAPSSRQTRGALHATYLADPVIARVAMNHAPVRQWGVLHPGGERMALTGESVFEPATAVEVHDVATGRLLWEWVRPTAPGHESAFAAGAVYSPDGSVLATGVTWSPHDPTRVGPPPEEAAGPPEDLLGVHLWDGVTHEPLDVLDVGTCGGWPVAIGGDVILVRALVASTDPVLADDLDHETVRGCRWSEGGLGLYLVDRRSGEMRLLTVNDTVYHPTSGNALSDDGSVAAYWHERSDPWMLGDRGPDHYAVFVDTSTGEELSRVEGA